MIMDVTKWVLALREGERGKREGGTTAHSAKSSFENNRNYFMLVEHIVKHRYKSYVIPGETLISEKGKRFNLVLDMPHI